MRKLKVGTRVQYIDSTEEFNNMEDFHGMFGVVNALNDIGVNGDHYDIEFDNGIVMEEVWGYDLHVVTGIPYLQFIERVGVLLVYNGIVYAELDHEHECIVYKEEFYFEPSLLPDGVRTDLGKLSDVLMYGLLEL